MENESGIFKIEGRTREEIIRGKACAIRINKKTRGRNNIEASQQGRKKSPTRRRKQTTVG